MLKTPLNVKVFNDIYGKIESKYYKVGDILPTEKEMETIYGTSRAPIRQALSRLENDGLISRKPGKGTFIKKDEVSGPWITMVGFGQEFGLKMDQVRCTTLSVRKIRADKETANYFAITRDDFLVHAARIRFLNDIPIYYLLHYTPYIDVGTIRAEGDFPSMRAIIKRAGIDIAYVSEELSAIEAKGNVAKMLQIEEGYPVMQLIRLSYDNRRQPVELTKYFVVTNQWKYRVAYIGNSTSSIPF
jgi:Transcriptional regulators